MSQQTLIGTCNLCGKRFSRASMTRHLNACGSPGAEPLKQSFHLFVEGRYSKAYWMHLAVPVEAPLSRVDAFLRQIWLECCGHLSALTIEGRSYNSAKEPGASGMGTRLSSVLRPGLMFTYEYDFGSTTELNLKVVGIRDRGSHRGAVELLARNDAPQIACGECGSQPATQICTTCSCEDEGWLCESCAVDHECGEEMLLPVVNSPRVGVCAYAGDSA